MHDDYSSIPRKNNITGAFVNAIPLSAVCAIFCGGRRCKYCNPITKFAEKDKEIPALYSNWITNRILASSRPNDGTIEQIIDEFKKNKIKSIINLQKPGEHAYCGYPLGNSGFSYNPQTFMNADIYFYNYGFDDFGTIPVEQMIDAVHVLDYAVSQGSVCIHCHAGLGRTGLLIACYLIYTRRITSKNSIDFVRKRRPNSIQTTVQIETICKFEYCLQKKQIFFDLLESKQTYVSARANNFESNNLAIDDDGSECSSLEESKAMGYSLRKLKSKKPTLSEMFCRQNFLIHGNKTKLLKYIPLIVYEISIKLLKLLNCDQLLHDDDFKLYFSINTNTAIHKDEGSDINSNKIKCDDNQDNIEKVDTILNITKLLNVYNDDKSTFTVGNIFEETLNFDQHELDYIGAQKLNTEVYRMNSSHTD
ncbi:hypothetical protein A3Q56_06676, partial [Intoshia linei]